MRKTTMSLLRPAILAGCICAGESGATAAGTPPLDPLRQCLDGGLPYAVGSHLCTSEGIVEICLRPEQSYGVKGIYTYDPNAKDAIRFDKAHWIATTSPRCRKDNRGMVYRSNNPRR